MRRKAHGIGRSPVHPRRFCVHAGFESRRGIEQQNRAVSVEGGVERARVQCLQRGSTLSLMHHPRPRKGVQILVNIEAGGIVEYELLIRPRIVL